MFEYLQPKELFMTHKRIIFTLFKKVKVIFFSIPEVFYDFNSRSVL